MMILVMLLGLAAAGLWQLTQAGWRAVSGEVQRLAAYEDQLARQSEVSLLLRLQDSADADWREVRAAQAARGEPAPKPAPRLSLLDEPGWHAAVAPTDWGVVRVDVYRQYRSPTGSLLTFRLPQFYRRQGSADWQRVNVPGNFWGEWLDWRSPHLHIRFAERDREWVDRLGPMLEERLSAACVLWGSPCASLPPARLFLSGFIGAVEYEPLANVQVRVEFPPGAAGQALPSNVFLAVPSPQLAGIPVDEASQAFMADYLSVRVIALQAERISPATAHALAAEAFFALGLRHADPGFADLETTTAALMRSQQGWVPPAAGLPAPGTPAAPLPPRAATPTPFRHLATHLVQPGDTLWAIAATYGVALERIIAANDLPDADRIAPGQMLLIPTP